ncbi:hypothetical protein A0H81_07134 [Grifola frondosa]|uniref:C2H2-type domain-containing protein n=1 Tax=Grifola frondosa TaxID=5627 RepID=A0A1C7MEG1_GRIFR|nr:hypothetical protein A0H81_07134 [Grifola frondosa]
MAAAQPISYPQSSDNNDFPMGSGSFTGQNGSFNPSSFTHRFIGSPVSWRAGSFGSRFYPGVSPGQLLGPLDPNEFKFGKMSSSIESDRGSIVNALQAFERQDELCRDYTCCGLNLTDLHALVDHFEECHVVVVDPFAPQTAPPAPMAAVSQTQPVYFSDMNGLQTPAAYSQGSFDPDDMELDDHPSGPLREHPLLQTHRYRRHFHPIPLSTTTVLPSRSGHSGLSIGFPSVSRSSITSAPTRAEEAFNAYAGYSDYSSLMPGTVPLAASTSQETGVDSNSIYDGRNACVPTALLLNSSAVNTPDSTPASSRVASPAPGSTVFRNVAAAPSGAAPLTSTASAAAATARASTTLSRPASSLLLSKPFRCPKPNCNKSYKQANGLKYHMTHGSCNFAPPKDLEHLQELLATKRSQKAEQGGEGISDAELREVEKEAERRLRPYACGVGECQRRYKNMNGLRYHYQHSGDHGAIGLALLASGQHECLQHTKSHGHSRHSTPSSSTTAPSATPSTSSPLATPAMSRVQSSTTYAAASAVLPSYQSATMAPPQYTMLQQQMGTQASTPTLQMPSYMIPMSQ